MPGESSSSLRLVGFSAAILSTIGWVMFAVAGNPDLPPLSDPIARIDVLDSHTTSLLMYGWGGTLGALFTIPYMFAITYSAIQIGPHKWVAFIASAVGALLVANAFMGGALSLVYQYVPTALAEPELAAGYVLAVDAATNSFETSWFFGSFLAYSVAIAWIAGAALRTGTGPVWLNWVGLAGAFAGIVWLRLFVDALQSLELVGSLLNIVLLSIWAIGMTFWLRRRT